MSTIKTILLAIIALPLIISCNAQAEKKDLNNANGSNEIQVYYFHFTHRCATCTAVEEETVKSLNELYANELTTKQIRFKSLNLDEGDSKELAEKLGVSGQALLFVKGDEIVNLTTEGFMNARSNPDKFKEKVKETVDKLLQG